METVEWFTHWLAQYQAWAGPLIFLVAFFDALALVGMVMPAAALIFTISVLMGSGHLPLASSFLWCFAGAVCGDGASFLLGYQVKGQLKQWRVFRRHPEWLSRSRHFIHQHGVFSIVLGRFIGLFRPLVPLMAGSLAMAPLRFFAVVLPACLAWAAVYLLPGFLVGVTASSEPALTRPLLYLLGAVAGLGWLWWWAFKRWTGWPGRCLVSSALVAGWLVCGELFSKQVSADKLQQLGAAIGALW